MRDWKVALHEYISDYYMDYLKENNINRTREDIITQ
jgi:hypothetical protein